MAFQKPLLAQSLLVLLAVSGAHAPARALLSSALQDEDAGLDLRSRSVQWSVVHPMEFQQLREVMDRYFDRAANTFSSFDPEHPDLRRPELVQFVDKTFGLGVRTWVVPDTGEWLQSDAHGWTWIPEAVQGQSLWVHAEGCYPQEFEAGGLKRTNQLSPSTWSILRVVTADGEAVAGLDSTWWSNYPDGDRYKPRLSSGGKGALTTADGFAWIAAARGSTVDLGHWDSPDRREVLVPRASSVVIEEPGSAFMLRLEAREPAASGVHTLFEVTAPADRFDIAQVGERGYSDHLFLEPRFGPLVIELRENLFRVAEPLALGWSRLGPTTACFWGAAEPDTEHEFLTPTTRLTVEQNEAWLWLKDRERQVDLHTSVRYRVLRSGAMPGPDSPPFEIAEASMVGLVLPESMTAELRDHGGTLELWPFGTIPEYLSYADVLGDEGKRSTPVEFDPARLRLIRVVDGAERVFVPRLVIATETGAVYSDGIDEDGLYPLDWIGGDVIVRAELPASGAPRGELVELARIPAALLETGLGVDLHVGFELGTVEVYGANRRGTDIVLVDHTGKEHRPARRDADRVLFDAVPPGAFVVAPPRWARQWWTRRAAGGAVGSKQLGPAELVRVPWNPDWSSDREFSGTVGYAASKVHGLFSVPCYGSPYDPMPLDVDSTWNSIDSDGTYRIHERDPIPSALLVCSLPEDGGAFSGELGKLLVHEVIEVGESVALQLGEVELVWAAEEWDGPLRITWEQARGKCRHPLAELLARNATTSCGAAWPTSANRVLKRLDPGALTLRFQSASTSWTETVEVEAGSRVVLRVRE